MFCNDGPATGHGDEWHDDFHRRFCPTGVGPRTAALHHGSNDVTATFPPRSAASPGATSCRGAAPGHGAGVERSVTLAALVSGAKSLTHDSQHGRRRPRTGWGSIDGADAAMFTVTVSDASVGGPNGIDYDPLCTDGPGHANRDAASGEQRPHRDPFNLALNAAARRPILSWSSRWARRSANGTVAFATRSPAERTRPSDSQHGRHRSDGLGSIDGADAGCS
jgi:hypothetical protein